MKKIFLTGFMGSGKTTMGRKLSKLLKLDFVDLDEQVRLAEGRTIPEIFKDSGEAYFREAEKKQLKEIIAKPGPLLISLGGGTICSEENLEMVKKNGILIYIELPATVLAARLKTSKTPRPLLNDLDGDKMLSAIAEKLEQRKTFYTRAHITANGLNLTPQHLHQLILGFVPQHTS